jgi:polyferredoxin
MADILFKIVFLAFVLPLLILSEGYAKFKAFLKKHNYPWDWTYDLLLGLIVLIIVIFLLEYGYS